ncbi:MAG: polyphosphate kinase 1 [Magnetospirillum sp. WYHS-4]
MPKDTPVEAQGSETAKIKPRRPKKTEAPPANSKGPAKVDFDQPEYYLNRELTWLAFNRRVLNEGRDKRTPLLERVKFLAIVASNLDEFTMKRIGGLKQQAGANIHKLTIDGRTPQRQISESFQVMRSIHEDMAETYRELKHVLAKHDIRILDYNDLAAPQKQQLRDYYYVNIFPLVTPQAMDPAHPFPFVSNLSLNLLVSLQHPGDSEQVLARVKVPVGAGIRRFLRVGDRNHFVPLEQVMANNLDLLFPGMEVQSWELFRVTRNANTEQDEDKADDLLVMIESELRERKFAPIVRLQIGAGMDPVHRGMLAAELGLNEQEDVFEATELLGMRDLWDIANLDFPDLHEPDHEAIDNVKLLETGNIFHIIRKTSGGVLLQHPYESFTTSVERFVREASRDPKVRAIKMTLYRTSEGTKIIDYLADAARNGKQVAAVVELKARFDEAANIRWASRLEDVGIHVTYGVVGLKTHSKVILVVRQDYDGLRRYAHIGTGNYHAGTARMYCDLGLLTCDPAIGRDLTELFNYLTTGYTPRRHYLKILPAPKHLKPALLDKIEREIVHVQAGRKGWIRLKCNALEDSDVAEALYRAGHAGVKVELVVRDTCRLRPGIPGASDNIRVVSIVGRFLEHSRIFHFHNAGQDEYLIGSADLMKRNLESRVEVVTPVEDLALQAELSAILDIQLNDKRNAWDMQPDGSYVQRQPAEPAERTGAQERLVEAAEKRLADATRLRKRKPKAVARRVVR